MHLFHLIYLQRIYSLLFFQNCTSSHNTYFHIHQWSSCQVVPQSHHRSAGHAASWQEPHSGAPVTGSGPVEVVCWRLKWLMQLCKLDHWWRINEGSSSAWSVCFRLSRAKVICSKAQDSRQSFFRSDFGRIPFRGKSASVRRPFTKMTWRPRFCQGKTAKILGSNTIFKIQNASYSNWHWNSYSTASHNWVKCC